MTAPIQKKLKIASAFSGGFGSLNFALKYENIPHEEVFAVEWMNPQRECYEMNHGKPTHGFYEDIREFDGTPFKGMIDLYHLSPVCFNGETIIVTEDGQKQIKDIRVGDKVLTHKNRNRRVLAISKTRNQILKIRATGSFEVSTTDNHPFLIRQSKMIDSGERWSSNKIKYIKSLDKPKWVEATNIKVGDYVGTPIIQKEIDFDITEEECYILGRYLADGYTRKGKTSRGSARRYELSIALGKQKYKSFIDNVSENHYNLSEKRTAIVSTFCNKRLVLMAEDLCGSGASNKDISEKILNLPKEKLKIFIDSYFMGDGYISKKGEQTASSVSKRLIFSMARAVLKVYNIVAGVHVGSRPSTCAIEGRVVNQKTPYTLSFYRKHKRATQFIIEDGIAWCRVKKIKKTQAIEDVFNMTVDEDNTYTANSIIVHNCTEFSMAGNRGGLNTLEGNLMFESIRSIDEVQPKIFTVENVAALTSSNGGEDWKEVLKAFRSLKGYSISWGKMNAKYYGGIQNRHRIFIVGFRADCRMMPFPQQVKRQYKLADFLEDEVDEKYYLSAKMLKGFQSHKDRHDGKGNGFGMIPKTRKDEIAGAISTKAGNRPTDNYIKEALVQVGNIDTKGHNSLWGRVYDTDGIAPTQNAHGGGAGAKTGLFLEMAKVNWFVYPHGANKGGFRLLDIAPTITTSSWEHNNFIKKQARIRRLTPRECSRVQGDFKDLYKFDGFSDTKKYEFIGNAIEINTMRHLIKRVLDFSKDLEWGEPQDPTFKQGAKVEQLDLFGEIA